jgi:hypothetical protein
MLRPLIRRTRKSAKPRPQERGFTMALVAVALVTIIVMAALSIDIGTLYQAKAEAQRAADAAALTAARVISLSGITGAAVTSDETEWPQICGGLNSLATMAATSVAQAPQNFVSGVAIPSANISVLYGAGNTGTPSADCSAVGGVIFNVNPTVTVTVTSAKLPVFFTRVFSIVPGAKTFANITTSATASAEVFNPSGSSPMTPVNPRCVKPWIVPNQDPGNMPKSFVDPTTGSIQSQGVYPNGVIGETFSLSVDCGASGRRRGRCVLNGQPKANPGTLDYVPGAALDLSPPPIAIPVNSRIGACADVNNNEYTEAVAGCDQTTVYACGTSLGNTVDLAEDPGPPRNDSTNGAQCLINASTSGTGNGQDVLVPATYPFQIQAGTNSALLPTGPPTVSSGSQITSSPSIVSLPIYDSAATTINPNGTTPVTIIGFLQVFINSVSTNGPTNGQINVTVMNVAGCGNAATNTAVHGTSPVPIRLITQP